MTAIARARVKFKANQNKKVLSASTGLENRAVIRNGPWSYEAFENSFLRIREFEKSRV